MENNIWIMMNMKDLIVFLQKEKKIKINNNKREIEELNHDLKIY